MSEWGRDHWTTLLYAEVRMVDYRGMLLGRHMRADGDAYPTLLKDGEKPGHNDYDCLADMKTAGLIVRESALVIRFTDLGWVVAAQARRFRAEQQSANDGPVHWDEFTPVLDESAALTEDITAFTQGIIYSSGIDLRQVYADRFRHDPGNTSAPSYRGALFDLAVAILAVGNSRPS